MEYLEDNLEEWLGEELEVGMGVTDTRALRERARAQASALAPCVAATQPAGT